MSYCQACGHHIHETATACPQCGAVQPRATRLAPATARPAGTLWLPVPALICALVPLLAMMTPEPWSRDELVGAGVFITTAFVLGGISLARQERGRGMSIAALALGGISLLGAIGMAFPS